MNINSEEYYFLKSYIPKPFLYNTSKLYSIREDFPILKQTINGKPLVWLDNAATTQKPTCVIKSLENYYSNYNSNIHRGAHELAKLATESYEMSRKDIQTFIGASFKEEIIFVRGTTEAINLVAESFGLNNIQAGDEIILSTMEHHSNIVPWQKLARERDAVLKVIPIDDDGEILLDQYEKLFTSRTKIVAITHVSNVLGTINPIHIMINIAHKNGAYVLIDGAQSVPHLGINVAKLDADFYVFSGHKIYAPTGIGILYGKKKLLEEMPPWQTGGGMIKNVSFDNTIYNDLPYKFEAGTPNIADAIALGVAIRYIKKIGMNNIELHERELTLYAMNMLRQIPGLKLIGTSKDKTSVLSFIIDGISSEKVAAILDKDGIAVRAGHHCAQPTLNRYHIKSCVRASIGVYNTIEDIERLVESLKKITL